MSVKKTGLYIHIPFCENKCSYCNFYKEKASTIDDEFIDLLIKEALFYKEEEKIKVDTIYFGGGSPILLSPYQLEKIIFALKSIFELENDLEFTMEMNPETINEIKLSQFFDLGINRVSLGIQSLNNETLKILGRGTDEIQILKSLETIFKTKIKNVSFDLIIGAPFYELKKVLRDLKILLNYPFTHSSLYILEIHKGSPLYELVKSGLKLFDDDEISEIYLNASLFLKENEFIHYEISNFAKKGFFSRHNLKYWKQEEYIGLGPSSSSYFRGYRINNPKSLNDWSNSLRKGEYPAKTIRKEEEIEFLENKIIFGLRLKEGIEKDIFLRYFSYQSQGYEKIEKLINTGYLEECGENLFLTEIGFLLCNEVLSFILSDSYHSYYEEDE